MTSTHREQPHNKPDASRIPRFNTMEEEAAFWDAHDLADFEDELEEVADVRFVVTRGQPKKPITVRVDQDTLAQLTRQAQAQGIGPSTLVRLWILERVRREELGHARGRRT